VSANKNRDDTPECIHWRYSNWFAFVQRAGSRNSWRWLPGRADSTRDPFRESKRADGERYPAFFAPKQD
jgi:hypothetical protein